MRVRFRRQALVDADEVFAYLGDSSRGAAEGFAIGLESAVRRLGTYPRIGHPVPTAPRGLRGMRSWPVPGFPSVLLLYLPRPHGVSILRVLHGARDLAVELGASSIPAEEE